jgi:hypothetical protein
MEHKKYKCYRLWKAFDNIQRLILFNILKSRNIPDRFKGNSWHIHTKKNILIKFNSKLSKLAEFNKGVHQGCPVSPILFNIKR